jgi:hypothetical protein
MDFETSRRNLNPYKLLLVVAVSSAGCISALSAWAQSSRDDSSLQGMNSPGAQPTEPLRQAVPPPSKQKKRVKHETGNRAENVSATQPAAPPPPVVISPGIGLGLGGFIIRTR